MKVAQASAAPRKGKKAKKKAAFWQNEEFELKTDSAQSLSPITALNGGVPHELKPVSVVGEKPAIEGSILKSDFANTKAVSKNNNKKAKRKAASRQQRGVVQSKLPYSIEAVPPVQKPVINVEIGPAPGGGTELKYVHVASGEVLFVWNPVAKQLEPVGDIVNRPAASSEVEHKPIGQKLDSTQSGGVIQTLESTQNGEVVQKLEFTQDGVVIQMLESTYNGGAVQTLGSTQSEGVVQNESGGVVQNLESTQSEGVVQNESGGVVQNLESTQSGVVIQKQQSVSTVEQELAVEGSILKPDFVQPPEVVSRKSGKVDKKAASSEGVPDTAHRNTALSAGELNVVEGEPAVEGCMLKPDLEVVLGEKAASRQQSDGVVEKTESTQIKLSSNTALNAKVPCVHDPDATESEVGLKPDIEQEPASRRSEVVVQKTHSERRGGSVCVVEEEPPVEGVVLKHDVVQTEVKKSVPQPEELFAESGGATLEPRSRKRRAKAFTKEEESVKNGGVVQEKNTVSRQLMFDRQLDVEKLYQKLDSAQSRKESKSEAKQKPTSKRSQEVVRNPHSAQSGVALKSGGMVKQEPVAMRSEGHMKPDSVSMQDEPFGRSVGAVHQPTRKRKAKKKSAPRKPDDSRDIKQEENPVSKQVSSDRQLEAERLYRQLDAARIGGAVQKPDSAQSGVEMKSDAEYKPAPRQSGAGIQNPEPARSGGTEKLNSKAESEQEPSRQSQEVVQKPDSAQSGVTLKSVGVAKRSEESIKSDFQVPVSQLDEPFRGSGGAIHQPTSRKRRPKQKSASRSTVSMQEDSASRQHSLDEQNPASKVSRVVASAERHSRSRQRGQDAAPRQCEEVKQKQVFRQQQELKRDAFTLYEWTKQRNFRQGQQRSAVSQREGAKKKQESGQQESAVSQHEGAKQKQGQQESAVSQHEGAKQKQGQQESAVSQREGAKQKWGQQESAFSQREGAKQKRGQQESTVSQREGAKQKQRKQGQQESAVSQHEAANGQRESLGKGTKQKPVVFERSIEQTIEQTTASQPVGWTLISKRRGVFEQKYAFSQQVEIKPESKKDRDKPSSEQNRRFALIQSGEKEQINSDWSQHAPGQSQCAKTKCASRHHQELEEEPTSRSSRHRQHGEAEQIPASKHSERVAGKSASGQSQRLEQNHDFSAISSQNQSPSRQSEMIAKFEQKPSSRRSGSGTKEPAFSQGQGLQQNPTSRRSEGAARSSPSSKSQDFEHKPRNRQSEEVKKKAASRQTGGTRQSHLRHDESFKQRESGWTNINPTSRQSDQRTGSKVWTYKQPASKQDCGRGQ